MQRSKSSTLQVPTLLQPAIPTASQSTPTAPLTSREICSPDRCSAVNRANASTKPVRKVKSTTDDSVRLIHK